MGDGGIDDSSPQYAFEAFKAGVVVENVHLHRLIQNGRDLWAHILKSDLFDEINS